MKKIISLVLLSSISLASASGVLGSDASVMSSPFCKKYGCNLVRKVKADIDFQFPLSTVYTYKLNGFYNTKSMTITRLKTGEIKVAELQSLEYSEATRKAVERSLSDFFLLISGSNKNESMWDIYYKCGSDDIITAAGPSIHTSKNILSTCLYDNLGIHYISVSTVK